MVELSVKKTLSGFEVSHFDNGKFKLMKLGEVFKGKFTTPGKRDLIHFRRFFALLVVAYNNRPERLDEMNTETFRKEIILNTKYHTLYTNFKGVQVCEAKSISFARMSENQFRDMYSQAMAVIIRYVLEGSREDEIERAVLEELNRF
jgi:hypothetical protein